MIAPPGPELAPARTFSVPVAPHGDVACAHRIARALRDAAVAVESAERQAHSVLDDAHRHWTGASARAIDHPLADLDLTTRHVALQLRQSADAVEHYSHALEHAQHQHSWSWRKILTVAAVVVVTTAVVVVTVGAAAPAAAAADAALVEGEIAATAAAAATATGAAGEAAEALTAAARALRALRAVASFVKPQVLPTAIFTDVEAAAQVWSTGHLDLGRLGTDAAVGMLSGATGERLAAYGERLVGGPLSSWAGHVFGEQTAGPLLAWLAPAVGSSAGWAATDAATQLLANGQLDGNEVAATAGGAFAAPLLQEAVADHLLDHAERRAGLIFGPYPPSAVPTDVHELMSFLDSHSDTPPRGLKGGKPYRNDPTTLPPGTYKEFDVPNDDPTKRGRGVRRIVMDPSTRQGYYTDSHYDSGFRRVR